METLVIGTRGSQLARVQTNWVALRIARLFPEIRISTGVITTSADKDTKTSIRSASSTGVFVREIEEALLRRDIDLAVHSMKDLPTRIPDGLAIGAIPEREDARDALIARGKTGPEAHHADAGRQQLKPGAEGPHGTSLRDLPPGTVVGTGSVRRQAQILALRPDLAARDIRGNVGTRLQKLDSGAYGVIILACAGLKRLDLQERISRPFEFSEMLPAPGQGALALEIRKDDERIARLAGGLNHPATAAAVLAERAFLRHMGGGCNSPIAVHARQTDDGFLVEGMVGSPDGTKIVRDTMECNQAGLEDCAISLAEKLLSSGGADILKSLH